MPEQFVIRYTEDGTHVAHYEMPDPELVGGTRKVYIGHFNTETATGEYRSRILITEVKPDPEQGWETEVYRTYGEWAQACAIIAAEWLAEGPPEYGFFTTGAMDISRNS